MPNRYAEILQESLANFGTGDASQREQVYRQARIALLRQFEADPGIDIERRADELALFEAAVREVEARCQAGYGGEPTAAAGPYEPLPPTDILPNPQILSTDDGPPLDVKLEAEERLYGEPEEEEETSGFPWVRIALLVILAALGVWFTEPLFRRLDPPALYAGLAFNALVLTSIGAVLFTGSRRVWIGLVGTPVLFAGIAAANTYSPGLEYAFEALFEPLSPQRQVAMSLQIPVLSLLPGGSGPAAGEPAQPETATPAETASTKPSPAPQHPMTATDGEPVPARQDGGDTAVPANEADEPAAAPAQSGEQVAAAAPVKLARLEGYEPFLGDWEIECDNGPGHRLTLAPPSTTGQSGGSDFARGRLTGEAFAGTSKVAFKSPLAENEIERDVEMPAHPWPTNEWVYAQETFLLRAEFNGVGGEGAPIFSTFFMCPIKAANVTAQDGPENGQFAIDTECSWYVPRPEDLDAFFSGSVAAQCRFRRPQAE